MKKHILTLIAICLTSSLAFAQLKATTSDGKTVILNDNGTWQYENQSSNNSKTFAGKWKTKKGFRNVPSEVLTIEIKGNSVIINSDQSGRVNYNGSGKRYKSYTGVKNDKGDYELSNGLTLKYNKDLDLLYLRSQWGGEEYIRY